jgi:membrane-bound metal-dependent hydrolase YbcI (DUF457 family)
VPGADGALYSESRAGGVVPSSLAHAAVALIATPILGRGPIRRRIVALAACAATLPDIDAIGRPFGHCDIALLGGHRAATHSVVTAVVVATALTVVLVRRRRERGDATRVWLYLTLVIASHGLFDAFTSYGAGVEFLPRFSMHRWKSSFQPFTGLWPEVICLWLPGVMVHQFWLRRRLRTTAESTALG